MNEKDYLEEEPEYLLSGDDTGDLTADLFDAEDLAQVLSDLQEQELTSGDLAAEDPEEFIYDPPVPEEPLEDFDELEEPAEPEEPEEPIPHRDRPAHKGRPRRKKGYGLFGIPHMLATVVWLLIILAIGVTLGRMLWVCAADVLAFGRESREVSISITSEDDMQSITEKLHEAGLINIPELFLLYADLTDAQEEITTGTFTLNTLYDYHALVNMLSARSGSRAIVENVLIPEGYNCRQIFQRLEEKGVCKAADLESWAATGELDDYWFLEGLERGDKYCLEGYLFPATYDFYENSTPKQVLEKMLDAFESNFTQELQDQLPVLNERISQMMRADGRDESYIAANQLTLHDLITVASLIEEETSSNEESPTIASVIYNRLYSWGSTPRYLNIDASIIYALGGKTDLTSADMAVDSPYNTYTNTGLTPGPISNPGLASLKAALEPADTAYYYYVLDPEAGSHIFAKTLAEHEKNVEEVRQG